MSKIKHNKYKNTGILFELLVRQTTSDALYGKDSAAISIIKKYFNKTELAKEYKIYQTLINSSRLSEVKANSLIETALELSKRLNRSTLRKEKYNLIKEIKENYNLEEFFKAKINNYKQYASAFTLIEAKNTSDFIHPQQIVENKVTLLEGLTQKTIDKDQVKDQVFEEYLKMDKGTRLLTYKIYLEKFNNKYENLHSSQQKVLKEYINNVSDVIKLRDFVNEQYKTIKEELIKYSKVVKEPTISIKLNEIISLIKPFDKNQTVKDDDMAVLLQYHQLINELKEIK